MAKLTGFKRLPGSSRRYVTGEGKELSYREYRSALAQAGLVRHLEGEALGKARQRQQQFNDIIRQMADVRRRAILKEIEWQEELGEEEAVEDLKAELRGVKREAIRSPRRKEAMRDLRLSNEERETVGGRRRYKTPEAEERARSALTALGRRENIPDWVPVGGSDAYRSGQLKRGGGGGFGGRTRRK